MYSNTSVQDEVSHVEHDVTLLARSFFSYWLGPAFFTKAIILSQRKHEACISIWVLEHCTNLVGQIDCNDACMRKICKNSLCKNDVASVIIEMGADR